jgi:hypothetical protein
MKIYLLSGILVRKLGPKRKIWETGTLQRYNRHETRTYARKTWTSLLFDSTRGPQAFTGDAHRVSPVQPLSS